MKHAVKKLTRHEFFDELLHFAAAYHRLTEQCEKMVQSGDEQQAENMIILRSETARKIDELNAAYPAYMSDLAGADISENEKRGRLKSIFAECMTIDNRLLPLMQEKMKSLQEQAHKLKSGQKALKGYGSASHKAHPTAVYVEEKK